MSYCYFFDRLPVELLHSLFVYFSAHEIILTFNDVSDYINAILRTYPTWQLNFQSIRRDHFDLICRYIQPENVISLTLSDDIDTPGQSELFFRRFRIEQFSHLRSLTLINIEFESLKDIFSDLDKLKQLILRSFKSDLIIYKYPKSINDCSSEFKHINSTLLDSYARVFPHLTRLYKSDTSGLIDISLPQLRHLKLASCEQDELKNIIQHAPVLESLDVDLELEHQNAKITLASSQLTRLRLKIVGEYFHVCHNSNSSLKSA
jgi:hypothetical protein